MNLPSLPGLDVIWRANPAVETAGYFRPRLRRWGRPVLPPMQEAVSSNTKECWT